MRQSMEYDPHASFANLAGNGVRADPFGEIFDGLSFESLARQMPEALGKDISFQPIGYFLIMSQQAEDFLPK